MSESEASPRTETTSGTSYYIRHRGRVTGPFEWNRIRALRKRGQLTPNHELSNDRKNWVLARTIESLFPRSSQATTSQTQEHAGAESGPGAERDSTPEGADSGDWYWSVEGDQRGPMNESKLRKLVAAGTVPPHAVVWSPQLDEWRPVTDVPAFAALVNREEAEEVAAPVTDYERAARKTVSSVSSGFDQIQSGRLWNSLLNSARGSCPESTLESISRHLMQWGDWAFALSLVLVPGILLFVATRVDSAVGIMLGIASFFVLAVLKYVAGTMNQAVHNLVVASPSRLASPAFPCVCALLFLAVGTGAAASLTVMVFQEEQPRWWMLGPALQNLLSFVFLAHVALQPGWLNIEFHRETTAGEEGIGILAFLLKCPLRLVPVFFGTGSVISTLGLLIGCFVYFDHGGAAALSILTPALTMLLAIGILPLVVYVVVALLFIVLDVFRSIIWLPEKLGELKPASQTARS